MVRKQMSLQGNPWASHGSVSERIARSTGGVTIDIANRGLRGNGDTEVELVHEGQLPYVMNLVLQAFARKCEDGAPDGRSRFAAS